MKFLCCARLRFDIAKRRRLELCRNEEMSISLSDVSHVDFIAEKRQVWLMIQILIVNCKSCVDEAAFL